MKYIYPIFFFVILFRGYSQTRSLDELKSALQTVKHDTSRCSILANLVKKEGNDSLKRGYNSELKTLAETQSLKHASNLRLKKIFLDYLALAFKNIAIDAYWHGDVGTALEYYNKSLTTYEENVNTIGITDCYSNLGNVYYDIGNISKAMDFYEKGLALSEKTKNKNGLASSFDGIGIVNSKQGDVLMAMNCFSKALKIHEELHDKNGIANSLNNIASVYYDQGDIKKSLEYYRKALVIHENNSNKIGIANSLNNIGMIQFNQNDFENALENFHRSLKIMEEIGSKRGIAFVFNKLAKVYHKQNNRSKAFICYEESMRLAEEMGDKEGIASALYGLGLVDFEENKIAEALKFGLNSLEVSWDIGYPEDIRNAAELLSEIYKRKNNSQKALENYQLYIVMRDSISHEQIKKDYMKAEYEKKSAQDSLIASETRKVAEARLSESNSKLDQEKTQRIALYGGLLFVCAFAIFIFNRFRLTQKQKEVILAQKQLVDHKQKEISDSINYAQRIQNAILPSSKEIQEQLHQAFLYYKPKDIVAGDFYWLETVNDIVLFAAADSTGHGVPGAMVSVVCSNALNRSVLEFGILEPGRILDRTRKFVLEAFAKGGDEVKDGMDISLFSLNKKTKELKWAGANNPLWYIHEGAMIELKADKQPIGLFDNPSPFTTHSIQLTEGDELFVFTDGFADQFGGPKGKKFKYKQLNELLFSISSLSMNEQYKKLDETFKAWKNDLEQVDDVLVFGVKV